MTNVDPDRPVVFSGVGVALVTLFHRDGALDAAATADLAARLVDLGVQGVVVAGSTGEAATLNADERAILLEAVRHAVPRESGVAVVAGTGAPSAHQAVALSRQARDGGADALLVLSPPGSGDLEGYYGAVRSVAGPLPLLAYHFPAMSAPGIPLERLESLPVDGCKDSSGDAGRLLATLTTVRKPLYTGSSALLALAGPLGCTGAILALANAEPERCAAAFDGDVDAQRALAGPEGRAAASFPAGIKGLVAERFGTATTSRLH